jgi:hypothetical protein
VLFDKTNFTATPNEVSNTEVEMLVYVPKNISFGDIFDFNVIASNTQGTEKAVSKLSVSARVPYWAEIFKQSPIPGQEDELSDYEKYAYPTAIGALLLAVIVFSIIVFIFSRFDLIFTGILVGLLFAILVFTLSLWLL